MTYRDTISSYCTPTEMACSHSTSELMWLPLQWGFTTKQFHLYYMHTSTQAQDDSHRWGDRTMLRQNLNCMDKLKSASFHSTDRETYAEYTVHTTSKGDYYTVVIVGFQGKYKVCGTVMV